jgi:hypothetical protein
MSSVLNRVQRERAAYKVVCVWCGGLIRHSSVKESRGMCLTCYARMLNEYFRQHQAAPGAASER